MTAHSAVVCCLTRQNHAGNIYIPHWTVPVSPGFSKSNPPNHPKFQLGHSERSKPHPKDFESLKYGQPEEQDEFSTLKNDTRPGSFRANLKVIILHSPGACPQQSRRGFGISYLANKLHSPCSQAENCLSLSAREHIISLPVNILCH